MPPELAVYGPIITTKSNSTTRLISYTVEIGTEAALEYTAKHSGAFSDGKITSAPAQSVAALMLQYGTQASNLPASAAVKTSLFNDEIKTTTVGGSKALNGDNFAIIPLQTDVIKEQLGIMLFSSGGTASSLMWIENNTGETASIGWGAGTYAGAGIRIGGFSADGFSVKGKGATVGNFDDGNADENHPCSLAVVLYKNQTSTINFYNPGSVNNTNIINAAGSLQATSGVGVSNWLNHTDPLPTPPAVSVIYKWKEK
jgi:hypothetical protein